MTDISMVTGTTMKSTLPWSHGENFLREYVDNLQMVVAPKPHGQSTKDSTKKDKGKLVKI